MAEAVVVCRGLSRSFGDLLAVSDVDLRIEQGTIYGFLGPNGSGKTTAIRMLCGLLTPGAGEVDVLGYSMPAQAEALRPAIGYMPQKNALYTDLSVSENLHFMGDIYAMDRRSKKRRIDEALERYGLQRFRHALVGGLSGGEKQKVGLAAATLHRPRLLFLDEPTSEVDPQSRRDFWDSLFDLIDGGATILVTTHFMDEAERCHRLAVLNAGRKMVDGPPQRLMAEVPAWVVLVETAKPRRASQLLAETPGVLSVAQIGASLRVLVERELAAPAAALEAAMTHAGVQVACRLIRANLEDVFVVATRFGGES